MIQVIAFQACKARPSHPDNKIAFTMREEEGKLEGGRMVYETTLCFVTVPEVAHAIVSQAVDMATHYHTLHGPAAWSDLMQHAKFNLVGVVLARRKDLARIAQKAA